MIFKSTDNQTLEFRIANYQFPSDKSGNYDSNWLIIDLSFDCKLGKWQKSDPSLTTWDVQRIIDWFELLSNSTEPKYKVLSFLEPNISFELLNNANEEQKKIWIKFSYESNPIFSKNGEEYHFEFSANNNELIKITNEIKREAEMFPERKSLA